MSIGHRNDSPNMVDAIEVRLRINDEPAKGRFITRSSLMRIKQFILNQGLRQTYSNMYNNNPAYRTENFAFFLDPDSGQANMNCVLEKSDFHCLTIRGSESGSNQYRKVEFLEPGGIYISVHWPSDDLTVAQIRLFVIAALKEILMIIEQNKPDRSLEGMH